MDEQEKQRRLDEIRKAQAEFLKQESEKKALPLDPNLPPIGAFAEDEPGLHASFEQGRNPAEKDGDGR